ncbi:AraC family transcriptional regulator [Enterococcus sp. DIV2469a]|uniref:helix-turn-helix transcriptional regulator n=1 Tax=unclassified Enterococcus TaxID=2608891 RepID=UPI003F686086
MVLEHTTRPTDIAFVSSGYEECTSTQSVGPIKKDYGILHFVTHGRGHYYLDNQHHIVEEAHCFFTPESTSVFYHADSSTPWSYCWICFKGTAAMEILDDCGLTKFNPIMEIKNMQAIHEIIMEMLQYYQITPANEWFIQSSLLRIFAFIQLENKQDYLDLELVNIPLLNEAIEYCQTTQLSEVTVTNMCEYLHISRTYLFLLFKEKLHMSPQQFITSAKIANSRELLAKSNLSIQEIAYLCGYKNQFSFSRAFKRENSITPTAYRQMYLQPENLLDR